jgi:hypothetical protein
MRTSYSQNTLGSALEQCHHELFELSDEMSQAFEATPEQLKASHWRREQAAIALDVQAPIVPSIISDLLVRWSEIYKSSTLNRREKRDNIANCLRACLSQAEAATKELERFANELRDNIEMIESAEFPGMSVAPRRASRSA